MDCTTDDLPRSLPVIITAQGPGSPPGSRVGTPPRLVVVDNRFLPANTRKHHHDGGSPLGAISSTTVITGSTAAIGNGQTRVAPLLFGNSKPSSGSAAAAAVAAAAAGGMVFHYRGETPRPPRGTRRVMQLPIFGSNNNSSNSSSSSGGLGVPEPIPGLGGGHAGASAGAAAGGMGRLGSSSSSSSSSSSVGSGEELSQSVSAAAAADGNGGNGGSSPRGNRRDSLFVPINPEQAGGSGVIRAAFIQDGVQQWLPSLPRTPRPSAKRLQSMAHNHVVAVTSPPKRSRTPGAAPEPTWSCTYTVGVEDALKRGFAHGLKIGFVPNTPQGNGRFTPAHHGAQGGDSMMHPSQGHLAAVNTAAASGAAGAAAGAAGASSSVMDLLN